MAILKIVKDTEIGAYLDYDNLEAGKLNPVLPAVNPVAVTSVPLTTGNATNRNELVVDPNGDGWFVDYAGDAVKITPKTRLFQALKTTSQATTTAFSDVIAWDVPTITDTGFAFDNTTGVLTLVDAGVYEVSAHLLGDLIANNRSELAVQLVDSSGAVSGALDRQYAMRNAAQDQGSTQFNSFLYTATAGESLKLQEQRVGSTANIVAARFTVKKVQ